jgi:arylsulfatase A-like enzyme
MSLGIGMVALMFSTASAAVKDKKARPNIILIMTDDQGWAYTSVPMMAGVPESRSDFCRTPALERMAAKGMVFSNAYSPAPVCTPTRCSIQFGKTPAKLRNTGHYKSARKDFTHEVSIAQALKKVDSVYATAHFGKWGGQHPAPEDAGYDVTDGRLNNYHGDFRSLDDTRPVPRDNPKRIFGITDRACAFMQDQVLVKRPFYLQLSHYAVHSQHKARPETIEKYKSLPPGRLCTPEDYQDPPPGVNEWALEFAAMIEDLDTGIRMVLDKLESLGIANTTYVFFTSDNGGIFKGNAPLRGQKAQLWEGGIRVPLIVCGPGIEPSSRCDEPVTGWDFLPTFVDLAGGHSSDFPDGLDGGSLRPLLHGTGKVQRPYEGLMFHFPTYGCPQSAIRLCEHKFLIDWETEEGYLFNLAEDLGENHNLAAELPKKSAELRRKLMDYLAEVDAEKPEDLHLERIQELKAQKQKLNIERREILNSDDPAARDKWRDSQHRLRFIEDTLAREQERLVRINALKRQRRIK